MHLTHHTPDQLSDGVQAARFSAIHLKQSHVRVTHAPPSEQPVGWLRHQYARKLIDCWDKKSIIISREIIA